MVMMHYCVYIQFLLHFLPKHSILCSTVADIVRQKALKTGDLTAAAVAAATAQKLMEAEAAHLTGISFFSVVWCCLVLQVLADGVKYGDLTAQW